MSVSMCTRHSLQVTTTCPLRGEVTEVYELSVETERTIPAEDILDAVARLTEQPIFQEELTSQLSEALQATVETYGIHLGVRTACIAVYEQAS